MTGITMPHNQGMIQLSKKLGFHIDVQLEEGIVTLELPLKI
ncbi:GCN5-like N-acetyltransferase [Pectobacterium actinidiae]|nr:GCN5-like N-acetyltransferase [Pectobacterium actinidiae]